MTGKVKAKLLRNLVISMTEDDWQEIDFIQDEVREELDNILENSSDGTSAWSIGDIWRKIFTKYMDELDRGGHS